MDPRAPSLSRDPLCLAAAFALGTGLSGAPGAGAAVGLLVVGWLCLRPRHLGPALALVAGSLATAPEAPLPLASSGRVQLEVRVERDGRLLGDRRVASVRALRDDAARALPPEAVLLVEEGPGPVRRAGERLSVRGRWQAARSPRNPGDHRGRPAVLQATAGAVQRRDEGPAGSAFDRLRRRGMAVLRERLPPGSAALGCALLFGERSELPEEWVRRFRDTGTSHLLALSGLHVALWCVLVERVLLGLGVRALWPRLLAVWAYALIGGAGPAVLRASFAASVCFVARHHGHRTSARGPLAWALVALSVAEPRPLHSAGLCLSFSAVLGILAGASRGPRQDPRRWKHGTSPLLRPGRALWVGTCATLATAPFALHFFGQVCPWSPLSTLLLLPFVVPWILLCGAILAADLAAPDAIPILAAGLGGSLDLAAALLDRIDALPGTPLPLPRPGAPLLGLHVLALLSAARGRWWRAGVLASVCIAAFGLHRPPPPGLCLLDVGHGQCMVSRDEDGCDLIDAGGRPPLEGLDESLRSLGVDRLRRVFLSHLDADHCGLLEGLLAQHAPEEVILSRAHRRAWAQERALAGVVSLRAALRERAVPVRFVVRGDRVGPWEVLWPPAAREFSESNDGSLVLRRDLGRDEILLPGDLGGHLLIECARGLPPRSRRQQDEAARLRILVLPHHGNEEEALGPFLACVRPDLAVGSRRDELPPATARCLRDLGVCPLATSLAGAIQLAVDAGGVRGIGLGPRPPGYGPLHRLLFRTEPPGRFTHLR